MSATRNKRVSGIYAAPVTSLTDAESESELAERSELARQRIQQGRGCGYPDFEANALRMHELNAERDERDDVEVPADHVYVTPQPGWGAPYGDSVAYWTEDGPVWIFRKGQRVRFYDTTGAQRGPEQGNIAPAVAFALSQGWGWAGCTS
jgi:hypothetical protein